MMLCCPITSQVKGYPFEVALSEGAPKGGGVVLADQVKSVDWRARQASRKGKASKGVMTQVMARIRVLLD